MFTDTYTTVFVLVVLAVAIVVAAYIRKSYVMSNQMKLAQRARLRKRQQEIREHSKQLSEKKKAGIKSSVLQREMKSVPTPWGWPQHGNAHHEIDHVEFSYSLRRFAGKLVHSKMSKDDKRYRDKRDASLRALLEDRYGRASRMTEIPYESVKAPLLRDPSQQPDQLDSMPSAKADKVVGKLRKQPKTARQLNAASRRLFHTEELKDVKTPWGW